MGRHTVDSTAATRGLVVQRILVDGWSPAQAAAAFGVRERQVARWIAAYRRHGMASLRDEAAAQLAPLRWARRLGLALRRMATAPRAEHASAELARFVISRRRGANRR